MYREDLLQAMKAAKRLTVQDIANSTGLSTATVSWILRKSKDDYKLKNVQKVADAVGLSYGDLFGEAKVENVV